MRRRSVLSTSSNLTSQCSISTLKLVRDRHSPAAPSSARRQTLLSLPTSDFRLTAATAVLLRVDGFSGCIVIRPAARKQPDFGLQALRRLADEDRLTGGTVERLAAHPAVPAQARAVAGRLGELAFRDVGGLEQQLHVEVEFRAE